MFRPLYLAASGAFLGLSMPLITAALPTQSPVHAPASLLALAPSPPLAHAEAPADVSGDVDDLAGVLSGGEEARLKEQIQQLKTDKRLLFSVFYIKNFDGIQGEQWAQQAWEHLGAADNRGVLVVAVEDRNLSAFVGDSFPSNAEAVNSAAQGQLLEDDNWAAAGEAAIAEAGGGSGSAGGWALGAGLGGAAVVGGTTWAVGRRNKKKRDEEEIARGRNIDPRDVSSLDSLSTSSLDVLARDEIVSTDESIRKASTELDLARAEFGTERIRSFDNALKHSQSTLERAFTLRQQLDDGSVADEIERRSVLLEIISTCGVADDQLDGEAANFQKLRQELMNAEATISKLTQRSVELRSRMPRAGEILDGLRARYEEQMLSSVTDNIDMATEHLNQADQSMTEARRMADLPAGEQGGLIDALSATDFALTQAESLLEAIEHADSDIHAAVAGLASLIAEVRGEIDEASHLMSAPQGANINRERLNAAIEAGREALGVAANKSESDPLSSWTALTDADELLDEALDSARDKAASFARATATLQHSMQDADNHIRAAADLIATRRRVVGAEARTRLAEAQRAYGSAQGLANDDPRKALAYARRARKLAAEAADLARRDIRRYQDQRRGGGSNGSMIAGMVLGSMLSNNSGFGGSIGGFGGFGGGSSRPGGSGSTMGF